MSKPITIEIQATCVGPHDNFKTRHQIGSLEIGVYANNGVGKTFLSRALRVAAKPEPESSDSNRLLSMGKDTGNFNLKIANTQETGAVREIDLRFQRGSAPSLHQQTTGYIFRVFNSDYVRENLEQLSYRPDGSIEGYIVGKEKIDLSKEKTDLENLKDEMGENKAILKAELITAKKELDDLNIRKNTTEYAQLTEENLMAQKYSIQESVSFESLKARHNQLKTMPDDIDDLKTVSLFNENEILEDIEAFLCTEFSKSSIAEDFKRKVREKQAFIEQGLQILGEKRDDCPFCDQRLGGDSLALIDQYIAYFKDVEAKQIRKANSLITSLDQIQRSFDVKYTEIAELQNKFGKNKVYIPSLSDSSLSETENPKSLVVRFRELKEMLSNKKENISTIFTTESVKRNVAKIEGWKNTTDQIIADNNKIIERFNERKKNVHEERLNLNRRLCNARFAKLRNDEKETIAEYHRLLGRIRALRADIIEKEQSERVAKKKKVADTFKALLAKYFGDKYTFNEDNYCLKLHTHLLETNASDVLSDGEKSIVAFSYFIAETHRYIEKTDDYNNLFFVIDDPVSSLDFHFVYATSNIIRTMKGLFSMRRLRLLLFTHNLEFMSILIRNKIIPNKFVLIDGEMKPIGKELIMPYEAHLRDIYNVFKGGVPKHTTPNSIRHVLETINRFVAPNVELDKFCEEIDGYKENIIPPNV